MRNNRGSYRQTLTWQEVREALAMEIHPEVVALRAGFWSYAAMMAAWEKGRKP